jgi:hypothetical protein
MASVAIVNRYAPRAVVTPNAFESVIACCNVEEEGGGGKNDNNNKAGVDRIWLAYGICPKWLTNGRHIWLTIMVCGPLWLTSVDNG